MIEKKNDYGCIGRERGRGWRTKKLVDNDKNRNKVRCEENSRDIKKEKK